MTNAVRKEREETVRALAGYFRMDPDDDDQTLLEIVGDSYDAGFETAILLAIDLAESSIVGGRMWNERQEEHARFIGELVTELRKTVSR